MNLILVMFALKHTMYASKHAMNGMKHAVFDMKHIKFDQLQLLIISNMAKTALNKNEYIW